MAARGKLSYPLSLAVVVALLVTFTGGWISWWNYRSGRANANTTAGNLFDQVAHEIAGEAGAFLLRAPPAAETLRGIGALDPPSVTSDQLAHRLLAALAANPQFSWISYSDVTGTFTGAYHPAAGAVRVNQSHVVEGGGDAILDEHDVAADGTWTQGKHDDHSHYDPRKRPFFELATRMRKPAWTQPYAFAMPAKADLSPGDRVPGITFADPLLARDGSVHGVVTIDFDLQELSRLVAKLDVSEHGRAVILAEDDTVIAHPTEALVAPGGDGALVKAQALADPALRALVAGGTARDNFDVDGVPYLARDEIVPLPGGPSWRVLVYAPESDFTGALNARVVSSLIVSLVGLVLAVVLAWLLAHRVSDPLIRIASEMTAAGDFRLGEVGTPRHSWFREIQMMIDALAKMKGGLRSFARYVPRDLVRAVLASGQDASLSGEVRQLTVYFSDLAGFTTLAEGKAPDELVHFLGEYLDDMSTIIADERGTVDKYLGDGIMAFWGAPSPLGDHAARACAAALRCQKRLAEYAARGTPLHTRIGVATGDVLVGNIGSTERMNYTVMGDTANLASRLESLNKQLGTSLMISEPTFEAARAAIVARPLDVVAVKGKSRGVRVYELLAMASDHDAAAEALAADAEAALDAYLARDFAAAIAAYDRILARTPGDQPAATLRARAAAFAETPPPPAWTGITIAKEK